MAGTNLVRTTLTGVRPLGVRGEPLHQAHEQIRGVVRRRLGERHARLLAEPQPDELGRRIDWYTDLPGEVVPFAELAPERKASLLLEVETLSQDIAQVAQSLKAAPSDDAQLTGRALELTARRPSDDYIFLIDNQPVIVAWGYEPEAAGALLPPPMLPAAAAPAAPPAVVAAPAIILASGPATMVAAAPFSWLRWLLIGLLAILLTLLASYFLRQCSPVGPAVAVTHLPPPPPPPAPAPLPDPAVGLRGDLGAAQADEEKLRATLAALRDELRTKRAACAPPEPPKPPPAPPPPVVEKKPDPPKPPPKPPQVVEKKPDPPPPPKPPDDGRMRMPKAPTNDYSFLQGCWRTDTFKHGPQIRPGYATYCFDARGNGSMTFRFDNGVTCRAPATARYNGGQLAVVDADANCEPRGRWAQDHLYCTPGADGVASCTGSNRTERWTVNLHRVR